MPPDPLKFPTLGPGGSLYEEPETYKSSGIPSYDFLAGLGISAASGVTELVGIDLPGAAEFRQDYPITGFITQLAGAAIPYTGWAKGVRMIGAFEKAVQSIGKLEQAPFLTGAAREAARFAPFEVGRLGVSQVIGNRDFTDMATDTALSLGLASGIGGLVHGLAASGMRTAGEVIPGVPIAAPPPLQLRKMKELVLEGQLTPEVLARTNARIREYDVISRAERLTGKAKYVSGVGGEGLTRGLNSMFTLTAKPSAAVRRQPFITKADENTPGFESEKAWRAAAQEAGLPEDFPAYGRFFRHITFNPTGRTQAVADRATSLFDDLRAGKIDLETYETAVSKMAGVDYATKAAYRIDKQVTEGLDSLGNNWFMRREEPDGLFVMARKVRGTPKLSSSTDSWVVFKTDSPGKFVPSNEKWKNIVLEKNSWHQGAAPLKNAGRINDTLEGFQKHFPLQNTEVLGSGNRISRLLPQRLQGASKEFSTRLAGSAREFLAPAAHQLKKSPLGQYVLQTARVAFETADNIAHETVYGRAALSKDNIFLQVLREGTPEAGEDNFRVLVNSLSDEEFESLRQIVNRNVDPELLPKMVQDGDITPNVASVAQRMDQLESFAWGEYNLPMTALGETPKKGSRFAYGVPRTWEGDTRITFKDAAGAPSNIIAAGPTRRQAQKNAKEFLRQNPELKIDKEYSLSQLNEIPKEVQATTGWLRDSSGLRGFKWDLEKWTRDDLLKEMLIAQQARAKLAANKLFEDKMGPELAKLAATDPVAHRIVTSRVNDLAGIQSAGSKWQNQVVDRVMAPILGPNSATKIVSYTNTGLYTWHLGMANIAHPLLNALTFVQTVIPEAAMLMRAGSADLSYYTFAAAGGTKGPVGSIGILSPLRLMGKSFQEMRKPREEFLKFFQRAGNEGVVAPRLAEEYIGETATKVADLRKAFSSGKDFAQWVLALSNWLPANSEKLSRAHAFTVGYLLAKDVLKLQNPEAIYRTAKEFTEKTMFLYTAADRPRIFTTPAGSALGLFKTWMMNYMANMVEYSGQAVKGNVAPLAWQTAGTAALGGVAATPLYWIADGFSKAFSDDSLLQNTYEYLGTEAGDAFMYGLPSTLTGISLYSQVASPGSNPARDASMLWSAVALNRMADLGKAAGLAFDHWQATGEHPGRSDRVRDAIFKSLAPSTVSRLLAAFSGEDMIRSLSTGYPIVKDMTISDRILYTLKLNPVEIDKAYQVQNELFKDREKQRQRVIALGTAFAEAQAERNNRQMDLILRQTLVWGLDISSVLRSSSMRLQQAEEDAVERLLKPEQSQKYEKVFR